MKSRNWFWGIFFLLAAVFVIASQTGAFGRIGLLSIAVTVVLAAVLIHGVIELEFFSTLISLALLYTIYQQPLHLAAISVWLLLLAAVLAATGLDMIFHSRLHRWRKEFTKGISSGNVGDWGSDCSADHFAAAVENIDDNNPCVRVRFGASSKYLHSDSLKSGQFYSSFGELIVYFDQVQLSPEGAKVYLDCSFGTIRLYIPRQWQIKNHVRASLGSVREDARAARPEADAPLLSLEGGVQFGELDIRYI